MGETQVTWNGCGNGEVTAFYTDLCFRETKEAKMETWEQPERAVIGLGTKEVGNCFRQC